MGSNLATNLVIKALKQGLHHRDLLGELMHHSDRGCQYTSKEFRELAQRHGIHLSMSAKGTCYDNTEHTNFFKFKTREEAIASIFEYIEVFYNRTRIHSTLGYKTPNEYEQLFIRNFKKVA